VEDGVLDIVEVIVLGVDDELVDADVLTVFVVVDSVFVDVAVPVELKDVEEKTELVTVVVVNGDIDEVNL